RYSPEIAGPRIGESRSEWEIIVQLARMVLPPEKVSKIDFADAESIREEIDETVPMYKGIALLKKEKDSFQYGGARILNEGICANMPDGKARFSLIVPQNDVLREGEYYLTT